MGVALVLRAVTIAVAFGCMVQASFAAGDFPVASCSSWNGTVAGRSGVDTKSASMQGTVTKADLQEYCERDPGGETTKFGGQLSQAGCVEKYLKLEGQTKLTTEADCELGTIKFRYGSEAPQEAKFPLEADADASCASGMPPLVAQFKMLCPSAASRLNIE